MRSPFDKPFGLRSPFGPQSGALSEAAALLATWADSNGGLAADFTDITVSQPYGSMKIIDGATPGNNWETTSSLTPFDKLTWTGASLRMCYGSDGVLRYAPHNLSVYSQTLATGWSKGNITVTETTGDTVDPFSGSNAQKVDEASAAGVHYFEHTTGIGIVAGAQVTTSRYFKYGDCRYVALVGNGSTASAWFSAVADLSVGSITQTGAGATGTYVSSSITAVGNGWYLLSITGVCGSSTTFQQTVCLSNSGTPTQGNYGTFSYTGANKYLYTFGASVRINPVHSTDYIATTSSAVYKPRIDYDPSTLAVRGLLVEEARTNLLTYSHEFDNAAWTKSFSSISANAVNAPDGTTTADKLFAPSTNVRNFQAYQIGKTISSGAAYTASCYMKAAEYSWGIVNIYDTTALDSRVYFDLSNGVVGTTAAGCTASIQSVGNGWYRCVVTKTSAATSGGVSIELASADGTFSFAGTVNSGIYVWGAQYEAGAFATSYIPTSSSSVTRAADAVSIAVTAFPWGGGDENTVYVSASPAGVDAYPGMSAGTPSPIYFGSSRLRTFDGTASHALNDSITTLAVGTTYKSASAWSGTTSSGCVNAGTVVTGTSYRFTGATAVQFGGQFGAVVGAGHMKQAMILPIRLSDANLGTLTT